MEEELKETKEKIKELREKREKLKEKIKIKNNNERKRLRALPNNNEKANINKRISNDFNNALDKINEKREENGFDTLSKPKITGLIIKHERWEEIKEAIIFFNTKLEGEDQEIKNGT